MVLAHHDSDVPAVWVAVDLQVLDLLLALCPCVVTHEGFA